MASDPAVELARGYTQCTRCNGRGFDSLDHTCRGCQGSGAEAVWLDRLRAALDAARVEERETCAARAHEVGQRLWDSSESPRDELQSEAAGAWAAERAIRGRR